MLFIKLPGDMLKLNKSFQKVAMIVAGGNGLLLSRLHYATLFA